MAEANFSAESNQEPTKNNSTKEKAQQKEADGEEDSDDAVQVNPNDNASDIAEAPAYLKIVITIRDNQTDVGMERHDTDPVFTVVHTTSITDVAEQLQELVDNAEKRWENQPRATTYHRPKPVQQKTRKKGTTPTPTRGNAPTGGATPAPAEKPLQSVEAPMLI